jgi:hypothetical protein
VLRVGIVASSGRSAVGSEAVPTPATICIIRDEGWRAVEQDGMQFELLAASLRADSTDLAAFTEALGSKLEGALPRQTELQRKGGGLFGGPKKVSKIGVQLGDMRYELRVEKQGILCTRGKAVRGIVLKTDELTLDEWIDALSQDLTEEASKNEQARLALERLVGP